MEIIRDTQIREKQQEILKPLNLSGAYFLNPAIEF